MYNKKVSEWIVKEARKKLDKSSKVYKDAHVIADIPKEYLEECIDLVGWSLMEATRLVEIFQKKVASIDSIYWAKFMVGQKTDFLEFLKKEVDMELNRRKYKVV